MPTLWEWVSFNWIYLLWWCSVSDKNNTDQQRAVESNFDEGAVDIGVWNEAIKGGIKHVEWWGGGWDRAGGSSWQLWLWLVSHDDRGHPVLSVGGISHPSRSLQPSEVDEVRDHTTPQSLWSPHRPAWHTLTAVQQPAHWASRFPNLQVQIWRTPLRPSCSTYFISASLGML